MIVGADETPRPVRVREAGPAGQERAMVVVIWALLLAFCCVASDGATTRYIGSAEMLLNPERGALPPLPQPGAPQR